MYNIIYLHPVPPWVHPSPLPQLSLTLLPQIRLRVGSTDSSYPI
jgi:hypothetical protein